MRASHRDPDQRLAEVQRQLERHVDHQLRLQEELDDKLEQLLAVALLIGGAGVATLRLHVAEVGSFEPWEARPTLIAMVVAITAAAASALVILDAYLGLVPGRGPHVEPGLHADWVAALIRSDDWTLEHVRTASIRGLQDAIAHNQVTISRSGSRRRTAMFGLLLSSTAAVGGIFMWGWTP